MEAYVIDRNGMSPDLKSNALQYKSTQFQKSEVFDRISVRLVDGWLWRGVELLWKASIGVRRMLTPEILEEIFFCFAGFGDYLIDMRELVDLFDARNDAGQPIVEVLTPTLCMLMGARLELGHISRTDEREFWAWRLEAVERPAWFPPLDEIWP